MLSDRGVSIIIFKLNNLAIKIYIGLFFQRKIVLQSESPSGMCAKLNTVAASNNRIHLTRSLYYCLFAPRIWVLFFTHTHSVQRQQRLQQHPLLFTMNRTDYTFFLWRFHTARPSHPGHSTIFLRSESPSGMCAKLFIVAASNNRVHLIRSLYYCLFTPHIWALFFTHIPFMVNRAFSTMPAERLQQ